MTRMSIRIIVPLLLAGCPGETVTPTESSSGEAETTSSETPTSTGEATATPTPTSETTAEPTGATSTTTGTSTSDDTGPTPPPVCGNGIVEGDEPCDDSNDDPDDGCNKVCERTGVPIWTQSWDGGVKQDDTGAAVRLDAEGNIYVAGTVERADDFSDAVVRKLDKDGVELLQFAYAGQLGLDDYARGLALTDDGGVVLCGQEEVNDAGATQAFIRKFDAEGEPLWTYLLSPTFMDGFATYYAVASDGEAIFTVGLDEVADKVFTPLVTRHDPDSGMPLWTTKLPEADSFSTHGIAVAPGGDVVIATALPGMTDTKPAIGRYAADDGAEIWLKTFSGVGYARAVAVHPDGDIAAVGFVIGEFDDTNFWIARISPEGEQIWTEKFDLASNNDFGNAVTWSASGDIYSGGLGTSSATLSDVFVRRWTGDGEVYWTSFYNDAIDLYDNVNGVAANAEMVVVVGNENVAGNGSNQWIRAYQP